MRDMRDRQPIHPYRLHIVHLEEVEDAPIPAWLRPLGWLDNPWVLLGGSVLALLWVGLAS